MEILAYRVALVDRSKESVWPSQKSAAVLARVSWSSALQAHQAAMSAELPIRPTTTHGCSRQELTFRTNAAIDGSEPEPEVFKSCCMRTQQKNCRNCSI
jgi:hypothetical protein